MKTQEVPHFYGVGPDVNFGGILLDGRFLNNRFPDSNSVSWRLLGSFSASQRYKVRRCCMKPQDVTISCGGVSILTLAAFYSMADSSTTAARTLILFPGGCWAHSRLHTGVACKLTMSLSPVEGVSMLTPSELYLMADSSTTTAQIPIRSPGGCWAHRQLHNNIRFVSVT